MSRRKPPSNGSLSPEPVPSPTSTSKPTSTTLSTRHPHSAFLPTHLERLLLALYPLTLLSGSLFSTLSPSTRNIAYNPTTQSHADDGTAPSYFARKRNIFNVYFVKIGWFWTTLALLLLVLTHPSFGPAARPWVPTRRRVQAALRWIAATLCWAATTQWFFGPPLIDRGFRFTGGACEVLAAERDGVRAPLGEGRELLTAAACKVAGGTWKGGHDISGHVFLLILGSALLWMELLPAVLRARGLREDRVVRAPSGEHCRVGGDESLETAMKAPEAVADEGNAAVTAFGVKLAVGVAALSWWMLLMTAAFFHTWFEKFTGLVVAFVAVWIIYFLPRGVPVLRDIVGMPGR